MIRSRWMFCVVALTGVSLLSARAAWMPPEVRRPRVLVTNDDGIETPGLQQLVAELATFAEVTVCAPPENRSGSSASIQMFHGELELVETEVEGAASAMTLSGTPADCAAYGLSQLAGAEPFDLLVSGINHGVNVGAASHYSGTVGAAMDAARRGVPAIAASMGRTDVTAAAQFIARFAQELLERGAEPSVVYSINLPNGAPADWKGVRAAPMGELYLAMDGWSETGSEGDVTKVRCRPGLAREFTEGTDSQLLFAGYVTICPLRFDWTHDGVLEELEDWELGLDGDAGGR